MRVTLQTSLLPYQYVAQCFSNVLFQLVEVDIATLLVYSIYLYYYTTTTTTTTTTLLQFNMFRMNIRKQERS